MENLTDKMTSIIEEASVIAMSQNHQKIMPEHILSAMLTDDDQIVRNLIANSGGQVNLLEASLANPAAPRRLSQFKVRESLSGQAF